MESPQLHIEPSKSTNDQLLEVKGLKTYFHIGKGKIAKAVDDVSFAIKKVKP